MKDYYAILGISVKAEEEVIIAAYKALVKKYHPDVYKGSKKEADARIRDINEAYETLSNKRKRKNMIKTFFKKIMLETLKILKNQILKNKIFTTMIGIH